MHGDDRAGEGTARPVRGCSRRPPALMPRGSIRVASLWVAVSSSVRHVAGADPRAAHYMIYSVDRAPLPPGARGTTPPPVAPPALTLPL